MDELDKISETKHGEEIVGILTHLTDPSQNSQFHDKYFEGIDFDLSRVLFLSLIHISEPTRLLSISYAVFCLKKKNKETNQKKPPTLRQRRHSERYN